MDDTLNTWRPSLSHANCSVVWVMGSRLLYSDVCYIISTRGGYPVCMCASLCLCLCGWVEETQHKPLSLFVRLHAYECSCMCIYFYAILLVTQCFKVITRPQSLFLLLTCDVTWQRTSWTLTLWVFSNAKQWLLKREAWKKKCWLWLKSNGWAPWV